MRGTNGSFDTCSSCKRLGTSRLHELHESKLTFVSRIEFIRSKHSNFSAHVSGVAITTVQAPGPVGLMAVHCRLMLVGVTIQLVKYLMHGFMLS